MRLTRSHVEVPLRVGEEVILPDHVAAHLLRVLRLQTGDAFVLFNGDGHDYDARMTSVGKREARALILAARVVDNESPLRITLLQGIARGEKMDWILQKATELGVARILPVGSDRSEVKLTSAWRIGVASWWRLANRAGARMFPPSRRRKRWPRPRCNAKGTVSCWIRSPLHRWRRCA